MWSDKDVLHELHEYYYSKNSPDKKKFCKGSVGVTCVGWGGGGGVIHLHCCKKFITR